MKGNDLLISTDKQTLYASKSCDISVDGETKEYAGMSADWKTFMAGKKSWSISTSYLVNGSSLKSDLSRVGETFTITVSPRGSTDASEKLTGIAICTQWRVTGTRGNLVQGSFVFQGTGGLT